RAGPDAGAATTMRDAEGLVQVQVRNVRAPLARLRDADQRIHVGAVGVHLPAVAVHDLADLDHVLLEDAVRGRVAHHDRGEVGRTLLAGAHEVRDADVPVRVALRDDDLHAAHLSRGRIRAVRGLWDQADGAMAFAARAVPGADRERAGVFPLRAGVGRQA